MVFWISSFIFVIVLHICVASNYYYKERNGNYEVYYGPRAQWGYKEVRSPKSYKINHGDRGDRPGKCIQGEFDCDSPYPIAKTKFFECDADYQCPRYFKCCRNPCFQHRICQPIDLDASDDNEIPDETYTETTSVIVTQKSSKTSSSTTESSIQKTSPDSSITSNDAEETTLPTQLTPKSTTVVKDEDIKQSTHRPSIVSTESSTTTVTLETSIPQKTSTQRAEESTTGEIENTQSTSTVSAHSTTPARITRTEEQSTTVTVENLSSSSSTFTSATTSKATQPSTPHSTKFTTTEIPDSTTITHFSTDMSTASSSTAVEDGTSTSKISTKEISQSTTIGSKNTQSTSAVSTQSSTIHDRITHTEEVSTTATVEAQLSSITFPFVSTSNPTQPSTSHTNKFTTTVGTDTTTISNSPLYMSTTSPVTLGEDESNTFKNTPTLHISESTNMRSTATPSTTIGSTGHSTASNKITHTERGSTAISTQKHSSLTTFPSALTSKVTQPSSSQSTKFSTLERSETTIITTTTAPFSRDQEEPKTKEQSTTPTILDKLTTIKEQVTIEDHLSSSTSPYTVSHLPLTDFTTPTLHISESTNMRSTATPSTTIGSTGHSTTSNKITHTERGSTATSTQEHSSLTTFPSALTSKVTQPSSSQSTKFSTVKRSETTIIATTTAPFSRDQEEPKTKEQSTTPTILDKLTTIQEQVTIEDHLSITTSPYTVSHLPLTVFTTPVITDKQEEITTSSQQTSTTQNIEDETTKRKQTNDKTTGTTDIYKRSTTNNVYTTIAGVKSTTLVNNVKETSSTVSPSHSTISTSETQPPTSSVKYETTESTTESITIKEATELLTDITLKSTTRLNTPVMTTTEMSASTIISSSTASDVTKSKTRQPSYITQSTKSENTSPISPTHNPTLQSKSTDKSMQDTSTSPLFTKTSIDFMTVSPWNTSPIHSESTELTTTSPSDYRQETVQSSLRTGKGTTRMVDVTSDDEDLIFSGDFEPSTIKNELPAPSINAETTTKRGSALTTQTDQTSRPVSDVKFDTSTVAEISTSTISSTSEQTTLKSATDGKFVLITDDEDLVFSGDGDWQATKDNSIPDILTTSLATGTSVIDEDLIFNNDSLPNQEVPQSALKQISSNEKQNIREFYGSSTSSTIYSVNKDDIKTSIDQSDTTTKLFDKVTTTSAQGVTKTRPEETDKDLTSKGDATSSSSIKPVTEELTTLTTDPETNKIITEDPANRKNSKENLPNKIGTGEELKNTQTSAQYSASTLNTLINSTPMQMNEKDKVAKRSTIASKDAGDISSSHYDYFSTTLDANAVKEKQTSTFKESNDITFSPDGSTLRTTIVKDTTADNSVVTPLPISGYPYGKVYMMDRLLGTVRKLPSVHEEARNVGDNYNFSNFLGILDKISDLIGKGDDSTSNDLDDQTSDQTSNTISELGSNYTNDQDPKQSTTVNTFLRQIVEVEN